MIISFSGRKGSGKTSASELLVNTYGFIKVSFADPLKQILSELYNINLVDFYDPIKKENKFDTPVVWDKKKCSSLSKIINEDIEYNNDVRKLMSIRECLQYIGTDVLKKHKANFHIIKTLELISDDTKNYCFDDCRFIDELRFLQENGAICVFIIRPNNFDISNHSSEVDLNWTMFDYILRNNCNKKMFVNRIKFFIEDLLLKNKKRTIDRVVLLNLIKTYNSTINVAKVLVCSRDKINWWCIRYMIDSGVCDYKYNERSFLYPDEFSSYFAGLLSADGCIKKSGRSPYNYVVELHSNDKILIEKFISFLGTNKQMYVKHRQGNLKPGYYITINSPYIIENIKFWNLKPRKSRINEVPDIIKYDDTLFKYWVVGIIDGDGSILFSKHGALTISILASKEIVDFIKDKYSYIKSAIAPEKKVDNLYSLRYTGKAAITFYKTIYDSKLNVGLQRKWEKIGKLVKEYDEGASIRSFILNYKEKQKDEYNN